MSEENVRTLPTIEETGQYMDWAREQFEGILQRLEKDERFGPKTDIVVVIMCFLSLMVQSYAVLAKLQGAGARTMKSLEESVCTLVRKTMEITANAPQDA